MVAASKTLISGCKQPKQARSTGLVAAILDAAGQVLAEQGAHRFTARARRAEGGRQRWVALPIFPNTAAILLRLQSDEWRHTTELLRGILQVERCPTLDWLRTLVHAFSSLDFNETKVRVA